MIRQHISETSLCDGRMAVGLHRIDAADCTVFGAVKEKCVVKDAGKQGLEVFSGKAVHCESGQLNAMEMMTVHPLGCPHDCSDREADTWPWPLRIYTLSRFSLVRYGIKVEFPGKVQQKPLAMLKALIALGGRNISAARIIDLIWPDMEPELSYQTFKITLHRLRRLLDLEQTIQFREGCLSINQHNCWTDIWTFERHVGRIDALRAADTPETVPEEIARLTDKALSLYSGNFLAADREFPWALSTRERLRSKFVRLVLNAGYYWERAGVWHKAAEYYQKGLEIDDLSEEFYQRLLGCYHHLGKRGEAQALYTRCRTVLAMQCITPTAKTRAAYEAVIND